MTNIDAASTWNFNIATCQTQEGFTEDIHVAIGALKDAKDGPETQFLF
jgi:predicted small secreted protein